MEMQGFAQMDVENPLDEERRFLEYVYGYPGEPDWVTALIHGTECSEQPDSVEMKQASKLNCRKPCHFIAVLPHYVSAYKYTYIYTK